MIDGALDMLRHKSHDVEAWFQTFDRAAKAGGWSDKVKGEILPVKLRDEALRYWKLSIQFCNTIMQRVANY